MTCQRWFEHFDRQVDSDDSSEFDLHCQQCVECRTQWERWRQLELDCWVASELFAIDGDEQAMPNQREGNRSDRPSSWLYWATAICALVLLAIGWFWAAMLAKPRSSETLANSQTGVDPGDTIHSRSDSLSGNQGEAKHLDLLLKKRDELVAKMRAERMVAEQAVDVQQIEESLAPIVWPQQRLSLTGSGMVGQSTEVTGTRKFQVASAMIWFDTKSQELDTPN